MKKLTEKLLERNIPDLMRAPSGESVKTAEEWERTMRPYWREMILAEEFGSCPEKITPSVNATVERSLDFAGKATVESVTFTFERGERSHTVPCMLAYPKGAKEKPVPFFIFINFRSQFPDRYLPAEEIIDGGFGIFSVCYQDITSDDGNFENGLAGLFYDGERAPDGTSKIAYWAYFASAMMDYLLTRPEADEGAIGISGHSRLGKTALLTAALDERFAFACPNNSGCSGVALSRGKSDGAEHIRHITKNFPFWFCPNYLKYVDNEQAQAFDQHCLVALVAPRAVFVGAAQEDTWADNDGQFLALAAASPVWELYGKRGLVTPDRMPEVGDVLIDGELGFYLRSGTHFQSRADWQFYMAAVGRYLKERDSNA